MLAQEIQDYLCSLDGGWVDWDDTTDVVVAGDPETEVTGIAVAWMPYRWTLRRALELGCNLVVTHEPTYYNGQHEGERMFRLPQVREKRRWIEESGLVIVRCHDVWDRLPGIGILDTWADFLGLGDPLPGHGAKAGRPYHKVYSVAGHTAGSLATRVAKRVAVYGQSTVELLGPAEKPVSRVAIGTGAITPLTEFVETGDADVAICTDDGFTYWREGALAIDIDLPVIVVNHAVSELYGIELLAGYLRDHFPTVPVHHIPQSCMFSLIAAPPAASERPGEPRFTPEEAAGTGD